jgi:hypothetical protein
MPQLMPPKIDINNPSDAEKFIFKEFEQSRLNDDFFVLHSIGLLEHDKKRRWAEIDFLVISPRGLLAIEVKGGGIDRDDKGIWHTKNRNGERHRLSHSPIAQASSGLHALINWIDKNGIPNFSKKYVCGFSVMFPDTQRPKNSATVFGAEASDEIIYWNNDKDDDISNFVSKAYKHFAKRDEKAIGLNIAMVNKVVNLLRGEVYIPPTPTWRREMFITNSFKLTQEQWDVFSESKNQERLLVNGSAGTGKTVLAKNITEAYSEKGTVLFLCFNKALAQRIRERNSWCDNVKVTTLHSLAYDSVNSSVYKSDIPQKLDLPESMHKLIDLFTNLLLDGKEARYDYLVIDEGQDILNQTTLDVLDFLVDGGIERGKWAWFMDCNHQAAVFGNYDKRAHDKLKIAAKSIKSLDLNCRNTNQIVNLLKNLFPTAEHSLARLDGEQVEITTFKPDDFYKKIKKQITKIMNLGFKTDEIVVLSPFSARKSSLKNWLKQRDANNFYIKIPNIGEIPFATVSAFKGLESSAIILIDVEKIDHEWWESVIYVGITRACYWISIFATENFIQEYKKRTANGRVL